MVNPGFDFSGVHHFWRIAACLEAGTEPAAGDWNALFATPGYQALTASEFTREFFQDRFHRALCPGANEDRRPDPFIEHYRRAVASRELLAATERHLRITPLADPARRMAACWLPLR